MRITKTRTSGNRIAIALPAILLLAGCSSGGFPNPAVNPTSLSVNPPSVTVAAGSTTIFTAVYNAAVPAGGALTWSVNPAGGGAITNAGVYTASANAGTYSVVATWTPADAATGAPISGSATVEVLPTAQAGIELNPNFTQGSGAVQVSGAVQNAVILGQPVATGTATDPNGNIQIWSGFNIPVVCAGSSAGCP
jgi:hypothetical protein